MYLKGMETNKRILVIVLCVFIFFISCKKEVEKARIYNYKIYNESSHVGFEKLITNKRGNIRIDSVFRYSKHMVIQDTLTTNFQIDKSGISLKNGGYYLNISADSCYNYKDAISDSYKVCYEGIIDSIKIEGKNYINVYKFSILETDDKNPNNSHSIKTLKYFDKDFLLIRNEYLKGYRRYFRVDRIVD
ncbi:hypothetical protein FS0810_380010 [Tenacibaculum maritimum]|nr:hypothetical protein FS0810_380010 [Tenacibaculum maritimum]